MSGDDLEAMLARAEAKRAQNNAIIDQISSQVECDYEKKGLASLENCIEREVLFCALTSLAQMRLSGSPDSQTRKG